MPIGGGFSTPEPGVKTGTFVFVAHANDPGDSVGEYLECNGQNVSRATYADLFAKVGVTWGVGDGATTFTLPDSRRRVPVGAGGAGTGTLGNAVGNTGGAETHTLTTAQLPAHNHQQRSLTGGGGILFSQAAAGSGDQGTNTNTSNTGGDVAHNNVQPSYISGVWIKT